MAGHSKFKNIMHRKGAQDARRAKKFARLIKELQVAARSSTDPESNPRLRTALSACKSANMPKDNIQRVLNKANSGEQDNLEDIRYEGYGPGGAAIIVEALTDNRNRTASEVRSSFTKYNGNLGESGSVSYLFKNLGLIIYEKNEKFDVEEVLDFWKSHNRSNNDEVIENLGSTSIYSEFNNSSVNVNFEKYTYESDENDSQIVHYKMIGGGHWWDYSFDEDLKTSALLWDFFSEHTKE